MSRLKRLKRILVLAASPADRTQIAYDQEIRAIELQLGLAPHGKQFDLVVRSPAQPSDLLPDLRRVKPTAVQIIAHGFGSATSEACSRGCPAPHRDIISQPGTASSEAGLAFTGSDGRTQTLSAAGLERTFAAAGSTVRVVILGACHSQAHAAGLLAHVEAVVTMGDGLIHDKSAVLYSKEFWATVAAGESVAAAHKAGCAAIAVEGLCDGDRPVLNVRPGLRAEDIVLADVPRPRAPRRKRPTDAVLAARRRRKP